MLRGDRVAIYPPHGEGIGGLGMHMRNGREPIGYLPARPGPSEEEPGPPAWESEWKPLDGFSPSVTRDGQKFTLTSVIPPMDDKGAPKLNNKGAVLTLHVQATFTDE